MWYIRGWRAQKPLIILLKNTIFSNRSAVSSDRYFWQFERPFEGTTAVYSTDKFTLNHKVWLINAIDGADDDSFSFKNPISSSNPTSSLQLYSENGTMGRNDILAQISGCHGISPQLCRVVSGKTITCIAKMWAPQSWWYTLTSQYLDWNSIWFFHDLKEYAFSGIQTVEIFQQDPNTIRMMCLRSLVGYRFSQSDFTSVEWAQ